LTAEFKYIVRIMGKDISGTKKVVQSLANIKGIGNNFAHYIVNSLEIDKNLRTGMLSDEQINLIEDSLKDIQKLNFPDFDFNRRKSIENGTDSHVIGTELIIATKDDIDKEKITRSWRGTRHGLNLKVRGQRTRCTGRSGRVVGVRKTALKPGTAGK
jgi:small subunit ribosomal protein S13